jgi:hypothetical protein
LRCDPLLLWFSVKMRASLAEKGSALRAGIFKAWGSIGPICFVCFRAVQLHARTSNLHGELLSVHKIKPGLTWYSKVRKEDARRKTRKESCGVKRGARTHACRAETRLDSSRRLCLDGSIGQQAPREVSARQTQVSAPRRARIGVFKLTHYHIAGDLT